MFTLTYKQNSEIREWEKSHNCNLRTDEHGIDGEIYVGAIGGAISYCFTPTSLGMCVVAKCACDEEINVTEVEDW